MSCRRIAVGQKVVRVNVGATVVRVSQPETAITRVRITTGTVGPAGADGTNVLNGAVDPTTEGVNGDFYINTTAWTIFGPKAAGAWGSGTSIVGPTGAAGNTILSGAVDPTTEGDDGDFYINTATAYIFGPKATTWPAGTALIGPTGDTGDQGIKGDTGDTGAKGDTGDQGIQGVKGDTGDTGAAGEGVPVGGTTGQVLTKQSATDHDSDWESPAHTIASHSDTTATGAELDTLTDGSETALHSHASLVEDDVYGAGWENDTTHAPSQNALFDKIDVMDTGLSIAVGHVYQDGTSHSSVVLNNTHRGRTDNPHGVDAADVGLKYSAFGFEDPAESVMSFVDGTRTFSIAPVGASFFFWIDGVRQEKTTAQSVVIDDSLKWHYIYFDSTGTLQSTQDRNHALFTENVIVASLYWNKFIPASMSLNDRRHGLDMSKDALWLYTSTQAPRAAEHNTPEHNNPGDGSLDTHAQLSMTGGAIVNADMTFQIDAESEPCAMPVFYRSDTYNGFWVRDAATDYPVKVYPGGRLALNGDYAGWGQFQVNDGNVVMAHIFATLDPSQPYAAIQGTQEYSSAAAAKSNIGDEIGQILDSEGAEGLPFEGTLLASVYFTTSDSYTNAVKATITWIDSSQQFYSWIILPQEGLPSHESLRDIGAYTHPEIDTHIGLPTTKYDDGTDKLEAERALTMPDGCEVDDISELTADAGVTVDGLLIKDGKISADDVDIGSLGTPTYSSVAEVCSLVNTSGQTSWDGFTDNTDGSVTVGAGTGLIRATNSPTAEIITFDWAENASVSLTDGTTNYIYVDYNSGSPVVGAEVTKTKAGRTGFYLGKVFREGTTLHLLEAGMNLNELAKRIQGRIVNVAGELMRASGLLITESGTRNIAMSAGLTYAGLTGIAVSALDTSGADDFELYYRDGSSGWTETDSSQISNTLYDDDSGTLATLANNRYGVHWVFVDADGHMMVVYGQGSYTLADAEATQVPATLPNHIEQFAVLLGRIIILKNATSFAQIGSAFTQTFVAAQIAMNESMSVLIDGTVDEQIPYVVPFDMVITGWTMLLDVSGSMAVDVWHDTYANTPPTDADSIVTPSVTSTTKNQGTGLSLAVSLGDTLIFNVDSVTTAAFATVALTGVRT